MAERRIQAGAMAGFSALLFAVAFSIQGRPPAPDEPTAVISRYLSDHREAILAGDLILAVAVAPFLWFLGTLRGYLVSRGELALSAAAVLGMALGTAVVVVAVGVQAGLVLNSAGGPDELVRFGFDAFNAIVTVAGGCFAIGAGALAASGARSGLFGPWLLRSGLVTAFLQLATLPGIFLERGPWAAGGLVPLVAFLVLVAWIVAVVVRLLRTGWPRAASAP